MSFMSPSPIVHNSERAAFDLLFDTNTVSSVLAQL